MCFEGSKIHYCLGAENMITAVITVFFWRERKTWGKRALNENASGMSAWITSKKVQINLS